MPALAPERRGPPARWLPRTAVVALVACALVAGIGVVVFNASSPNTSHSHQASPVIHAVPVSFHFPKRGADSGYIIATVTDPFAAQSSLNAAFKAAGLDIVVTLVPASPSAVGTVVALSLGAGIQTLYGGTCVEGGAGCPIGLKIPRDFTGKAFITLGRPAETGESYTVTNSAFTPGESLHCSALLGAQVQTALPALAADKITTEWSHVSGANNNTVVDNTPPPATYYIWGATPVSAGTVRFDTQPTPLPADLAANGQRYDQGC